MSVGLNTYHLKKLECGKGYIKKYKTLLLPYLPNTIFDGKNKQIHRFDILQKLNNLLKYICQFINYILFKNILVNY